jgi:lipopolysaccharide transport system permease protein
MSSVPAPLDQALPRPATTVIEPSGRFGTARIKEVWEYRELLYFLVWRDIKIRYKQTGVGVAWAILQPFLTMVVFTVIFGHFANLPTGGIPYPILTYTALLPWMLFTSALQNSTMSVVSNQALVTKVYFPRLLIPMGPVFAALVDFVLAFAVLAGLMAYYGYTPTIWVVTLPLLLGFAMATALAVGLWLSSLNVRYRDVQYAIPFLIQIWFFATPVAYSAAIYPLWLRPYLGLNPMSGVVQGFRWALLGDSGGRASFRMMAISFVIVIGLLVTGIMYFHKSEKSFADVI